MDQALSAALSSMPPNGRPFVVNTGVGSLLVSSILFDDAFYTRVQSRLHIRVFPGDLPIQDAARQFIDAVTIN